MLTGGSESKQDGVLQWAMVAEPSTVPCGPWCPGVPGQTQRPAPGAAVVPRLACIVVAAVAAMPNATRACDTSHAGLFRKI